MADILDGKIRELVAMAASVACGCEPCLKYHYDQAKKAGCNLEEMSETVSIARKVKQAPPKAMDDLTLRLGLRKEE